MPSRMSAIVARCLRSALPVLCPVDHRIRASQSGLYCVEGRAADGWRLRAFASRLDDAFALGQGLHAAPAGLAAARGGGALPASYRVLTEDGPGGLVFRSALHDGTFAATHSSRTIVQLEPLGPDEAALFVGFRLRCAGRDPRLVDASAVLALSRLSGGSPRQLAALAGVALFLADIERSPVLLARHVEHALVAARPGGASLQTEPAAKPQGGATQASRRKRALASVRFGAAAASFGALLLVSWAGQRAVREWSAVPTTGWAVPEGAATDHLADTAPELPPPTQHAANQTDPALDVAQATASIANREDVPPETSAGRVTAELTPKAISGRDSADGRPVSLGSFAGLVNNDTLGLSGKLSLELIRNGAPGVVRARFHASDGLLGTGELSGTLTADGRMSLSGQLSMGRNPFLCRLDATIRGDHITGSALFVRPWGGRVAHSSFNLLKS